MLVWRKTLFRAEPVRKKTVNLQQSKELFEEEILDAHLSRINYHAAQSFLQIILTVSTNFINLPYDQTDKGINDALKLIGDFFQVGRSYVFQISQSGHASANCFPSHLKKEAARFQSLGAQVRAEAAEVAPKSAG
jgi:hypothetical protein